MKKQISRGIALSFFSQIITIIVGLVYTPIMIRILGQSEYGLYQLVLSVVNYLNLMNLGFNGAYIRYYVLAKNKNDDNEVANVNGMFMKVFLVITSAFLSLPSSGLWQGDFCSSCRWKPYTQRAVPPASDNLLGTPAGAYCIPCQKEGHFRMSHTGAGFPSSLFY